MPRHPKKDFTNEEKDFLLEASKVLQELREAAGLNQTQLAQIFNLSRNYISQLETANSQPTILIIKKYCDYFGVTFDLIFGYKPKEEIPSPIAKYSREELVKIVETVREAVK